jgi:hypothetical protein
MGGHGEHSIPEAKLPAVVLLLVDPAGVVDRLATSVGCITPDAL